MAQPMRCEHVRQQQGACIRQYRFPTSCLLYLSYGSDATVSHGVPGQPGRPADGEGRRVAWACHAKLSQETLAPVFFLSRQQSIEDDQEVFRGRRPGRKCEARMWHSRRNGIEESPRLKIYFSLRRCCRHLRRNIRDFQSQAPLDVRLSGCAAVSGGCAAHMLNPFPAAILTGPSVTHAAALPEPCFRSDGCARG
jgi:hypothetical protein